MKVILLVILPLTYAYTITSMDPPYVLDFSGFLTPNIRIETDGFMLAEVSHSNETESESISLVNGRLYNSLNHRCFVNEITHWVVCSQYYEGSYADNDYDLMALWGGELVYSGTPFMLKHYSPNRDSNIIYANLRGYNETVRHIELPVRNWKMSECKNNGTGLSDIVSRGNGLDESFDYNTQVTFESGVLIINETMYLISSWDYQIVAVHPTAMSYENMYYKFDKHICDGIVSFKGSKDFYLCHRADNESDHSLYLFAKKKESCIPFVISIENFRNLGL